MDKKIRNLVMAITLTTLCCAGAAAILPVSASENKTNSKGNFILEDGGDMALYASDIDYEQPIF